MRFKITLITLYFSLSAAISGAYGQRTTKYDLAKLYRDNKLDTSNARQVKIYDNQGKHVLSTTGIVWLKDEVFKDCTIDIDLRGKDVFLKSFLGIAFHAKDTLTYETICFRPFRFHSKDIPTRKWSVQYTCVPGFDYDVLRKTHPGLYENEVNPVPGAEDWFHATIVVKGDEITVYVNHSLTPSLRVKTLNKIRKGKIGLWTSGLSEDFSDLAISKQH